MNTRAFERLCGLSAVAMLVCAGLADGQVRGGGGGPGGMPAGPVGRVGGPIAGLGGPGPFGGVPSQAPRPISLGNQGGIPLYRTNTLLPPDAALFRQRPQGPILRPTPYGAGVGGGLFYNAADRGGRPDGGGSSWWHGRTGTGGTTVDGSYHGDKWNVRFHLGSGYPYNSYNNCNPSHWGNCYPNWNCYPRYCYYPLSWYGGYWGGYNSYYPSVVYSDLYYANGTDPFLTTGQAPAAQQPAPSTSSGTNTPPREMSAVEKAEVAWRSGRNGESIQYFREHLKQDPQDADSMRYFAMVLIDERRIEQAVAMMALAYEKNPKLANNVLPVDLLPGGAAEQRRRVNAVSTYANRVKTSSAWLTLAALIQSEGRDDVAAKVIEKAKAAGGSPAVLDEMLLGLKTQ